jgi:hypothetical protein
MSNISQTRGFTKFSSSFVDESLFGTRKITREPEEPCKQFDPPWITEKDSKIKRTKPLLFYCPSIATSDSTTQKTLTTANKGEIAPCTPKSKSRPSSARNNKRHMKCSPSYVDESLFKSARQNDEKPVNFDPPWVRKTDKKPRPILWDYSGCRPASSSTQRQVGGAAGTYRTESARSERGKSGRTDRMVQDNRRPWR